MIKNYFKIAWRNLVKNKSYTLINIGGLAVGMAVAIVIGLWIHHELSFNKNFKNHDRIAQVMQHTIMNGTTETWSSLPPIMSEGLRNEYGSDFRYAVQGTWESEYTLGFGNKMFIKTGSYFEPEITKLLSLNMLNGDINGLKEMHSILLSQSLSEALFGKKDPVGEILKLESKVDVKVTGVYEDFPKNSSFKELDFILPWDLYLNQDRWTKEQLDNMNAWYAGGNTRTFVQLDKNTILEEVSFKVKDIMFSNISESDKLNYNPKVFLHPMAKWHMYADFKNGNNIGGRINDVWLFGVIGLFVLLLACINFMNLSTARSEKRAKEVGIRKAIGSNRRQLISQFFGESILVSIMAFMFSIVLVVFMLPFFNGIADSQVVILWSNPLFWIFGLTLSVFTGIIAGLYPALYLSSFKPVKVLKGVFKTGQNTSLPRQVLVVSQFTISVMLIIGTIVVYQQIQYGENRPMGYNKNGLIRIPTTTETHKDITAIRLNLINQGAILEMAECRFKITDEWNIGRGFEWEGKDSELMGDFHIGSIGYNYGKTIGWKIKEGRDFSREFRSDSIQFILNESAVTYMNLKNPVGKMLENPGNPPIRIIGVVEDLLIESPYEPVKPYIFVLERDEKYQLNEFLIKLNPEKSVKESLAKIEALFKTYNPSRPFEAKFVDEAYAKKFGNEKRISQLVTLFAILAIFISCLGLFGLASYVAEQRTKEIGVRKVLGASVIRLWKMLSKDFLVLVIVACTIAAPIAYYIMDGWLQKFEYRTSISWWVAILACGGAVVVTLITVSYQGIRAAQANPIKSLKTE